MKRMLALAILFATTAASAQAQLQTTPLYPLKIGTRWIYVVTTSKGAATKDDVKKNVTIEVERSEPFVRKKKGTDGKEVDVKNTGFILKMTSGAKITRDHVVVLEDGVYKVHVAGTQISPPLCFIKLGPDAGKGWEANSKSGNTTVKGTFTVKAAAVKVPAGNFDSKETFLISFVNNKSGVDRIEIDCWYVVNVGMVRQRVLEKGNEIVLELEK